MVPVAMAPGESGMDASYDAIVLGAGHNGLILQAYLARAGLSTLALEERGTAGGGLSTLEDPRHPSVLHNPHAFFLRAITRMPWFRDLGLDSSGLELIEPELNVALVTPDDRLLAWWTDIERTILSFAAFSKEDARTLRRWHDDFVPILADILLPEATQPPLEPGERRRLLERSAAGKRLLEVSALSPLEFVQKEFSHPTIQAGLLFFNGLREVDLRAKGFGHHIASLLASPAKAQMAKGGTAELARALERAVLREGGKIRTWTRPAEILIEQGRAVGVRTEAGERIGARHLIASTLNPHQTFLALIAPEHLPAGLREKAEGFRYNLLAPLFALHLVLNDRPRYAAEARHPELDRALMVILGLDHLDRFGDIVRHHEAGTVPPTVMWGACPTVHDPSQAPPGRHAAFMWEKLPFDLGGDPTSWDRERAAHGEVMLDLWRRHAPNLEGAVIDRFTRSPLDIARSLSNMQDGDLLIGAFTHGQIGWNRPFAGAGQYRTPVPGLYLAGSASHPGGNITGLPGYNAAQVALADLGLPAAWAPEPLPARLARLA
jgi:phytoene dehydrogenase-like protein